MTTTSPWAPQTGAAPVQGPAERPLPPPPSQSVPPQPPAAPPPPVERPKRRPGLWGIVLAMAILMVVAVAATAAIAYAIARNSATAPPPAPATTTTEPQVTAAERDAAKTRLCNVFDSATRDQQGQGGLVQNGQLNIPLVLRTVNAALGVQVALTEAVPADVSEAARTYVNNSIDLTSAAMRNVSIDEGNRLNDRANAATYALADVCGLPH